MYPNTSLCGRLTPAHSDYSEPCVWFACIWTCRLQRVCCLSRVSFQLNCLRSEKNKHPQLPLLPHVMREVQYKDVVLINSPSNTNISKSTGWLRVPGQDAAVTGVHVSVMTKHKQGWMIHGPREQRERVSCNLALRWEALIWSVYHIIQSMPPLSARRRRRPTWEVITVNSCICG